jgi:hypothetical protein
VSAGVTIARRAVAPMALVVGLTLLAACGSDTAPMTRGAATELHTRVAAVRAAADARDPGAAANALDELRAAVDRLHRSDELTDARAADIRAAAAAVEAQLVTITTTTTTTTTPRTTAPAKPTAPPATDDKGNGNGKGKGKGGKGED